jgi:histidinol-phosphate aminotransferase
MEAIIDVLNAKTPPSAEQKAKLDENESPFGPSKLAIKSIIDNIPKVSRYTDEIEKTFQEEISKKDKIPSKLITVSNGSDPLLRVFGQMIAKDGQGQLIVPNTTYESVVTESKKYGALITGVDMNKDLSINLTAIENKINKQTTGIYICNPNNPTGNKVNIAQLRDFIARVSKYTPCLIDEAYIHMVDNWEKNTVIDMVEKFDNVMVTRTFSKIYGLAGQRIGYAAASPNLMYKLNKILPGPGFTNSLGLYAALASMEDQKFLPDAKNKFKKARNSIYDIVKNLGLEMAADPQACFVYFNTKMNAENFQKQMAKFGVLVVGRVWAKYPTWSRVSVGLDWEIDKFKNSIEKVIKAEKQK